MPPNAQYEEHVPRWAAELISEVRLAVAQHGARIDSHDSEIEDHEGRIRNIEANQVNQREVMDLEARMRVQESRRYITPATIGAVFAGLAAVAAVYWVFADLIPRFAL